MDWPPTVSQIRETAFNLSDGDVVPLQPWEAWERAVEGNLDTPIGKRAIKLVGGDWSIKRSEKPDVLRSQFIRAYTELLDAEKKRMRASRGVKALAEINRPEEITPPERRISEPERINAPTQDQVSEMLKQAGLGAYAREDGQE
jgi:hypothetical protein